MSPDEYKIEAVEKDGSIMRLIIFETDFDTGAVNVKDMINGTPREICAHLLANMCFDNGLAIRKVKT